MNPLSSANFGMFQRRLVLLSIALIAGLLLLFAQVWRLAVVEHDTRLERAIGRVKQREFLPSTRGAIVDRKGRVLVEDAPSYDVALHWDALSGEWPRQRATAALVDEAGGRRAWARLPLAERTRRIDALVPVWNAVWHEVLAALTAVGGMPADARDHDIAAITARVEAIQQQKDARDLARRIELYGEDGKGAFRSERVAERSQFHPILRGVDDATAFAFGKLADRAPGAVTVQDSVVRRRSYETASVDLPCDGLPIGMRREQPSTITVRGVASRILGVVRTQALAEDERRRPLLSVRDGETIVDLGGYDVGPDVVGLTGIERAQDDTLRGTRGLLRTPVAGPAIREEPVPGGRVELTLDAALQARVEAILDPAFGLSIVQGFHAGPDQPLGTKLACAVVVLDVDTGDVLAMASWPELDDDALLSARERAVLHPWMDRAMGAAFEPGSVMKPVVLACAAADDVATPATVIDCTGHFFPGVHDHARCWIYRPQNTPNHHGPLAPGEAIARSCNIFFYTLADRLGARRLMGGLDRWGFGRTLDVGLDYDRMRDEGAPVRMGEVTGSIRQRDLATIEATKDRQTVISLGIGQGDMRVTPLQVANAYAAIARGGVYVQPSVVRGRPRSRVDLGVPDAMLAAMRDGLRRSVDEEYGTLHHVGGRDARAPIFDMPGIRVWGKSGTAETSPVVLKNADGTKDVVTSRDHSWTAGFAGAHADGRPRVAVCAFVDHGGGGGKTAGPIAAAAIRACADEGYLGDALASRTAVRFPDAPVTADASARAGAP